MGGGKEEGDFDRTQRGEERKGVVMKYSGLSDLAALVLYEDAERIETIITKHTNSLSFLLVNWITRCYVT